MSRQGLKVIVKYAAAPKPFMEDGVDPQETLGSLKERVLRAFGLSEGSLPDGNAVAYKLYHNKDELTDLSHTLQSVANHAAALELKLSQFVTQGTV
jgi:hypothetical protein